MANIKLRVIREAVKRASNPAQGSFGRRVVRNQTLPLLVFSKFESAGRVSDASFWATRLRCPPGVLKLKGYYLFTGCAFCGKAEFPYKVVVGRRNFRKLVSADDWRFLKLTKRV